MVIRQNITANRFMSFGTFHTFVKPVQKYGITFGGQLKGLQMDIDRLLRQQVANNNKLSELKNFIQAQGPRQSANEHLVPEQLFDNPKTKEKEVEGVSAVKAIQIAAQQGQKVFFINADNKNAVLPRLNHGADVMEDIHNALNAGKEVQVHEKAISYSKWTGSGYIILDKQMGAGAYLISGGANGAAAYLNGDMFGAAIGFNFFALSKSEGLTNKEALKAMILSLSFAIGILIGSAFSSIVFEWTENEWACFASGILTGIASTGLAAGLAKAKIEGASYEVAGVISQALLVLGIKISLDFKGDCLK